MEFSNKELQVLLALKNKALEGYEVASLWGAPDRASANGFTARLSMKGAIKKVEVYMITDTGIQELVSRGLDGGSPVARSSDTSMTSSPEPGASHKLVFVPRELEEFSHYNLTKYTKVQTFEGTFYFPKPETPPLLDSEEEAMEYARRKGIRKEVPWKPHDNEHVWKFDTDINVWVWTAGRTCKANSG